jgi:hypothetical protein
MFCKECGAQISAKVAICIKCGVPTDYSSVTPKASQNNGEALRMVIPVDRSGYAIAAGYLGLFSVMLLPAPLAILFGILALKDIKSHPEKIGKGRAWFGIIMGGIFVFFPLHAFLVPLFYDLS